MTPSQLAEAMSMTKGGAVTAMIDRLERRGYLRRTRDTADRRQVLIQAIPGGPLRQLMSGYAPVGDALIEILAGYTDQELELITGFTAASNQMIRQVLPAARAAAANEMTA
jgi:DNA-binding MarR family transcriptional regulator